MFYAKNLILFYFRKKKTNIKHLAAIRDGDKNQPNIIQIKFYSYLFAMTSILVARTLHRSTYNLTNKAITYPTQTSLVGLNAINIMTSNI